MSTFYGFNCPKAVEPLQGESLLLTTKSLRGSWYPFNGPRKDKRLSRPGWEPHVRDCLEFNIIGCAKCPSISMSRVIHWVVSAIKIMWKRRKWRKKLLKKKLDYSRTLVSRLQNHEVGVISYAHHYLRRRSNYWLMFYFKFLSISIQCFMKFFIIGQLVEIGSVSQNFLWEEIDIRQAPYWMFQRLFTKQTKCL